MKQVTMTLETARGLYKNATAEMKKWLEENFDKKELANDYNPPSDVYGIMRKYNVVLCNDKGSYFGAQLTASAKLLCLMQDYYEQTGWKRDGDYYTLCLYYGRILADQRSSNVYSPLQFKTESHAYKFAEAYKDLLLEYFNAK